MVGGGGGAVEGVIGVSGATSRCAGLSLSRETVSCRPLSSRVKYLSCVERELDTGRHTVVGGVS